MIVFAVEPVFVMFILRYTFWLTPSSGLDSWYAWVRFEAAAGSRARMRFP